MSIGQAGKKQPNKQALSAETRKAQADTKRNKSWSEARRLAQENRKRNLYGSF
jgi:hypothetical protein